MNKTDTTATPPEALRRKRLRLAHDAPSCDTGSVAVQGLVEVQVDADNGHVTLCYDVRHVSLDTLVEQMRGHGIGIVEDRRARMAIAWQSYLDRNARANLANPGSPCCSNPTSVYAARGKREEKPS